LRRQTATGGVNPAGSGRTLRLDPHSLPVSFDAHDTRADGGVRHIELHHERVVLRRAVSGMRMAINVRVRDFLGIARRGPDEAQTIVLVHRDPSLSIPLCVSSDHGEIEMALQMWSEIFALPQLSEDTAPEPAPRQCDQGTATGFPGAAAARRPAQSRRPLPRRTRDHRARLTGPASNDNIIQIRAWQRGTNSYDQCVRPGYRTAPLRDPAFSLTFTKRSDGASEATACASAESAAH
jgi:hypothetical protein